MLQLKELEHAVATAISKYGIPTVIVHINSMKIYDSEQFIVIKKIITAYFNICERDLELKNTFTNQINARRMMVYLLLEKTNFTRNEIKRLTKIGNKTLSRYIARIGEVKENNNVDSNLATAMKDLEIMYNKTLEKTKTYNDGK